MHHLGLMILYIFQQNAKILNNNKENSAGEDCLSSDYDDQDDSGHRCSSSDGTSSSITVKETCTCAEPVTRSTTKSTTFSGLGQREPVVRTVHDSVYQSPRRAAKSGKKSPKRPRPKTLEELLTRLGLQVTSFLKNSTDNSYIFRNTLHIYSLSKSI